MSSTVSKVQKYFDGTSSYPLMVVVSSDEYKEVLEAFSNVPKMKVSAYCIDKDKEPDTGKVQADIENCSGKNILIGLGDYLASKTNIAKRVLSPYKDLVLKNDARVVVLLSAHMYPILKEICGSDLRARTRIIFPETPPTIAPINSNAFVYGIKAYLDACEKGENVGSVKTGRNLSNVNVIDSESAFDELKHKYPSQFRRLAKSAGTGANWSELLENLNRSKQNIGQYLAEQNFVPLEYTFINYAKRNDYTAWLYFINLKLNAASKSYLGYVASRCETLSNLFSAAKTAILDIAVTDEQFKAFYEQRKTLLKNCEDHDMADFTSKIAIRGIDRIAYLTDNTNIEKKATITALCDGAKKDFIPTSYPDLHLYMQSFVFEDDKITRYFNAYKECKITNKIDNGFANLVDEYAATRPYNSFPARSALFSDLNGGDTLLIFLDAMGVEYLGYVKEKCAELGLRSFSRVARAELPTITSSINKSFYDEWSGKKEVPIKDLDDIKHDPERGYDHDNSPYPIHLAEELNVIKEALERAKTKISAGECSKVVISSDHGASRLVVISADTKTPNNGCEAKSNGRYCVGSDLPDAPNIVMDVEGGRAVIADYSRFEGSRIASVETHGGATLEEVLVPIIELTLSNGIKEVTLENDVIEVSFDTVPTINFYITPDCDDITASVAGKLYLVEKPEKSKFKVVLPDLKKGKYTLDIFENQNPVASKEFTIKSKGFAERDMF